MSSSSIWQREIPLPRFLQTWLARPRTSGIKPFRFLLRKELRESRGLLIAGLWTYWLMPAAVESVMYVASMLEGEKAEAWACAMLTAVLGWFFAVVTGAQVVCRDWGRAEEHFLRAQPIRPADIVRAKWWTGLIVIAIVSGVAVGWDLLLSTIGGTVAWKDVEQGFPIILLVPLSMIVGYSVAFVAAFATRQMLTAVLAGCLLIVTCWAAPLLSRHFEFMGLDALQSGGPDKRQNVNLLLIGLMVAVGAVAILAARWAARREMHLRLNTKAVAWSIAGLGLLLFGMALAEVGNALPIRDRVTLEDKLQVSLTQNLAATPSYWSSTGGTGYLVSLLDNRPLLSRVEITGGGEIKSVQTAELVPTFAPNAVRIVSGSAPCEREFLNVLECTATPNGCLLTMVKGLAWEVIRAELQWRANADFVVHSKQVRRLPDEFCNERWGGMVSAGRYLYFFVREPKPTASQQEAIESSPDAGPTGVLYVHDWLSEAGEDWAYRIPLLWRSIEITELYDQLVVFQSYLDDKKGRYLGLISVFDPQRPDQIAEAAQQSVQPIVSFGWEQAVTAALGHPIRVSSYYHGGGGIAFDPQRGLLFVSDPGQVQVYRTGPNPLASYFLSRMAGLLRTYQIPQSKLVDGTLLANTDTSSVMFFDTSDPAHLRPAGFCNLTSQRGALVLPLDRWLLIVEPTQALVVERP